MSRMGFTRGDVVVLVAGAVLAAVLWAGLEIAGGTRPGCVVVVNVGGADVETIRLAPGEKTTRTVRGPVGLSTFEVVNGRVRMVSSDCPDKICVKTGWASRPGQVIVCLPNRVVLKVESR